MTTQGSSPSVSKWVARHKLRSLGLAVVVLFEVGNAGYLVVSNLAWRPSEQKVDSPKANEHFRSRTGAAKQGQPSSGSGGQRSAGSDRNLADESGTASSAHPTVPKLTPGTRYPVPTSIDHAC